MAFFARWERAFIVNQSTGTPLSSTGQNKSVLGHNIKPTMYNVCYPVLAPVPERMISSLSWKIKPTMYLTLKVPRVTEDITWPHGDTKFLSECWKIFHEWVQQTSAMLFQKQKINVVSPSGHVMFYLLYKHQWTTKPFHFNSFLVWKEWFIM